ncbi:MAG: hypothetical protein UV73_C0009G0052, partial [Candidatus Gottesmanbacteria bacterium GW2011_GWA2_43_14]
MAGITQIETLHHPGEPLSRREAGKVFGTTPFAFKVSETAARLKSLGLPEVAPDKGLDFITAFAVISELDIIPNSLKLGMQIDEKWTPQDVELSFISRNKDLLPERTRIDNPQAHGFRVRLKFTQGGRDAWESANYLKDFIANVNTAKYAWELTKSVGPAVAATILLGDESKNRKSLSLVIGLTVLGSAVWISSACNNLSATNTSDSGVEATKALATLVVGDTVTTPESTRVTVETFPLPEISHESKTLSRKYLIDNAMIAQNRQSEPVTFPPNGDNGAKHENVDLSQIQYANKVFGEFRENWNDPMWVMKYLVSQG